MKVSMVLGCTVAAAAVGTVLARRRGRRDHGGPVTHAVTVMNPPEEVRAAWNQPGRLPGLPATVAPASEGSAGEAELPEAGGLHLRVVLTPAPGERGTEIRVRAEGPGAGAVSGQLRADLRHIKAVLECGEALTVAGQPSGRGPRNRRVQDLIYRVMREGGRG